MSSLPSLQSFQSREFRSGQICINARNALMRVNGRLLEPEEQPEFNERQAELVCFPHSDPKHHNPGTLIFRFAVALPESTSQQDANRLADEICYPLSWMRKAEINFNRE